MPSTATKSRRSKKPAKSSGFSASMGADALCSALKVLGPVIERRSTLPILSCVHIEGRAGTVYVSATDLDCSMTVQVPAESVCPGSVCVDAFRLSAIVKAADGDATVAFGSLEGNDVSLRVGGVSYRVPSLVGEDWPRPNPMVATAHSFKSDDLPTLFARTKGFVSTEETRYYLNGVYLHVVGEGDDAKLRAVATNGHMLGHVDAQLPSGAADMPGVIIRIKHAAIISKLRGMADVTVSDTDLRITAPGVEFQAKAIAGSFPEYSRVIPHNSRRFTVDTNSFAKAVGRVVAVSLEKSSAIKLSISPMAGAEISLCTPDGGKASAPVKGDWDDPNDITVGMQKLYLDRILREMRGELTCLNFDDAASAIVVTDPHDASALFVIMPMQV